MSARSVSEALRDLEAMVGRSGPQQVAVVYARDIERYAIASGDAVVSGMPAPPTMLSSVIEWGSGTPLGELRPDGTGVGREGWLPLQDLRLMGGGQDLVLHRPVLAGTEFVAEPTLESATLKEGRSGAMVLLVITTVYRTPAGEELVTCRETLIAR